MLTGGTPMLGNLRLYVCAEIPQLPETSFSRWWHWKWRMPGGVVLVSGTDAWVEKEEGKGDMEVNDVS